MDSRQGFLLLIVCNGILLFFFTISRQTIVVEDLEPQLGTNYYSKGNALEKHSSKENYTAVVLLTYMRSGSSLTGDILQKNSQTFYWFEPLSSITKMKGNTVLLANGKRVKRTTIRDWSLNTLLHLFSCNLGQIPKELFLNSFMKYGEKTKKFTYCVQLKSQNFSTCLQSLQKACEESKFRVVKTIRFPMQNMSTLLSKKPRSKVVHLVRDPRSVIESRSHRHTCLQGLEACAREHCIRVWNDTQVKRQLERRYRNRVHTVQYEDLAIKPVTTLEDMYKFVGIPVLKSTREYAFQLTLGGNLSGCLVCQQNWQAGKQKANSIKHLNKWKTSFKPSLISSIEKYCAKVFLYYGYEFYSKNLVLTFNKEPK